MKEAKPDLPSKGCFAVAGGIGLLLLIGMCSSGKNETAQSFASPSLSNQIEAMEVPASSTIEPLDEKAPSRGHGAFSMAISAEGLSGAMIYSQNCYDGLSRTFTWSGLDACGAFDLIAVKSMDGADAAGLSNEEEYFGSEEAAGRYLAVATKAGADADSAETRLEQLQHRIDALPSVSGKAPTPAESVPIDTSPVTDEADEEPADV